MGCAAALAVIEADILQRLLAQGALDFAVRIDCSDLAALPAPEVTSFYAAVHEGVAEGSVRFSHYGLPADAATVCPAHRCCPTSHGSTQRRQAACSTPARGTCCWSCCAS